MMMVHVLIVVAISCCKVSLSLSGSRQVEVASIWEEFGWQIFDPIMEEKTGNGYLQTTT
jgi:hypothetical protein